MDKLDSTQLEQLQAIGAYLSEIRQEQSRTLEEIAARTYIPLRLLRAIEAGQSQALPEPVFVQGFIRRYADALGLDGWDIAQQFPVQSAVSAHQEIKSDYIDETLARSSSQPVVADAPLPQGFSMRRPRRSSTPYWITGISVVLLGGLFYLLSRPDAPPATVATPSNPTPAEAESSPADLAPPSPTPSAVASSPIASPDVQSNVQPSVSPSPLITPSASPARSSNAPVTVDVSLTDDSWMQVIVDGQVELEETLPRGTKRSWNGRQSVTIVAGNAGAVQVAFNNASAERMGAPGAVEERTFTANSNTLSSPSP